jgi:hypothetical protein
MRDAARWGTALRASAHPAVSEKTAAYGARPREFQCLEMVLHPPIFASVRRLMRPTFPDPGRTLRPQKFLMED